MLATRLESKAKEISLCRKACEREPQNFGNEQFAVDGHMKNTRK